MGSFNVKCGLTGEDLVCGAQAVGFMFVPQDDSNRSCLNIFGNTKSVIVSNDGPNYLFRLETLPIELSYEDSGQFIVLNDNDSYLQEYLKIKDVKLDAGKRIDACEHNLFVVSKKAYQAALSSKPYIKIARKSLNLFKKLGPNINTHLKDRGDTPLAGFFLEEGDWSYPLPFYPKLHKVYKTFYLSDPKALEKKMLEMIVLDCAMFDVGRFYHKVVGGSQRSNTNSVKYLYNETFKIQKKDRKGSKIQAGS